HAVSRLAALLVMSSQRYAREEGKAQALASPPSIAGLLTGLLFGLLPMLLLPVQAWLALLHVLLVWVWFSLKLKRSLGGYTGDCLGAMQQLTELAFYLGIVIISI
ncbi:MAG: adenosylcobinamide-GDP ribazoletransferase, partial [Methylobacillus glycogenes]|nr:adenosylcobinamide-GDP ribazoletransferase [Methylobacillus glycogenes]